MASAAASVSRPAADTADEVSLLRLHVLRVTYLLLVAGLGATVVPVLFSHEPTARGVIPSLLGGVWLLAFVGVRYPLQMLPLLMFEFVWKTIWLSTHSRPFRKHEDYRAARTRISTLAPTASAYLSMVLNVGRVRTPLSRRHTALFVVHILAATSSCVMPVAMRAATRSATRSCNV